MSIALAAGPALGLAVLQAHGTTMLWGIQSVVAVVAALIGFVAIRRGRVEAAQRMTPRTAYASTKGDT
jgi:hypothetical protein